MTSLDQLEVWISQPIRSLTSLDQLEVRWTIEATFSWVGQLRPGLNWPQLAQVSIVPPKKMCPQLASIVPLPTI